MAVAAVVGEAVKRVLSDAIVSIADDDGMPGAAVRVTVNHGASVGSSSGATAVTGDGVVPASKERKIEHVHTSLVACMLQYHRQMVGPSDKNVRACVRVCMSQFWKKVAETAQRTTQRRRPLGAADKEKRTTATPTGLLFSTSCTLCFNLTSPF